MKIEYTNMEGKPLCFYHAVKAIVKNDEKVTASVPDTHHKDDLGGTGYLGQICAECFPEEG